MHEPVEGAAPNAAHFREFPWRKELVRWEVAHEVGNFESLVFDNNPAQAFITLDPFN